MEVSPLLSAEIARPRMPREPQSRTGRTRDALLLGFFVLGLDAG